MTSERYIIANWKMHAEPLPAWAQAVAMAAVDDLVSIILCPSFTQLAAAQMVLNGTPIELGAQDCHQETSGAYTGCVSADMLKRSGCSYAIVGHSERRQHFDESNELVWQKAKASALEGLTPIVCVGESLQEREAGNTLDVISTQLEGAASLSGESIIIAYEPVWAIGTGKTPNTDDIAKVHTHIKKQLEPLVPVVYGGSVKPANAAEIHKTEAVDGVLVGGASLNGESFAQIITA